MMKRLSYIACFCCAILAWTAGGCAKKVVTQPGVAVDTLATGEANRLAVAREDRRYLLKPGDVIDVKFYYSPELNEQLVVRPDGRISLQLVDEVTVEGLTPAELDSVLTERYTTKIPYPEISVIVKQFPNQKIYVGGEVQSPGIIQLSGRMTTLQAIFEAGGFRRSAKLKNIVILRDQGKTEPLFVTVNLHEVLRKTGGYSDIVLKPHDIVFVPKTTIAKLNDFVSQYIDNLIPISAVFGLTYNLNPTVEVK